MEDVMAYIGLGGNLGHRWRSMNDGLRMLGQTRNLRLIRTSRFIDTTPLADPDQPTYLNCVSEVRTGLDAAALHRELQAIETAMGRERGKRWGPRNIDLDLLLYGEQVIETTELIVPHRQMHLRTFALDGLCELKPDLIHPVLQETVRTLAERLNGGNFTLNGAVPQLICITGNIGAGKTTLARTLAKFLNCETILEQYDTNPYLPQVYAGRKEVALDSEMYFLKSRTEQLSTLPAGRLFIADYLVQKQLIYAKIILEQAQFAAFEQAYNDALPRLSSPVLVIHLEQTPDVCLDRIHIRNRPYEQKIETDFLRDIAAGYKDLLAGWKSFPVIRLVNFDCLGRAAVERLAEQIKHYVVADSVVRPGH